MVVSKNLKSFLSDSILYTILNVLDKAIPFFILPFIVNMMSTKDFGHYSLFLGVEALIIPLVSLNLHAAISTHYYSDGFNLSEYLSTIIYSVLGFSFIFFLLSSVLPDSFEKIIGVSSFYLKLVVISGTVSWLMAFVSTLLRLQRRAKIYAYFSITKSVSLFLFLYIFCSINPTYSMLVMAKVFYSVLFFTAIVILLKKKNIISLVYKVNILKKTLMFSLPTLIYTMSALIILSLDRLYINYFLGADAVGYYSAVFQLASIISVLGMSINAAWVPWLFDNLNKKNYDTNVFIVKITYAIIFSFFFLGLVYCLIFPFFAKIILPIKFHQYIFISVPLIMGFVFQSIYLLVSPYINFAEQTKYSAYLGLSLIAISLLLNTTLIPYFGIFGVALTNCVCWLLLASAFYFISVRVYPMPWLYFLSKKN